MNFVVILPCIAALVSCQSLDNLPRITVDKQLLQSFGVNIDVNDPGLYQAASSEILSQGDLSLYHIQLKTLMATALNIPAKQLARQLIAIARPAKADKMAELVIAHALNALQRLKSLAEETDDEAMKPITMMLNAPVMAMNNMTVIAMHATRDAKSETACSAFTSQSDIQDRLSTMLRETAQGKGALFTLWNMFLSEQTTNQQTLDFARQNRLVAQDLSMYVMNKAVQQLQDYADLENEANQSKSLAAFFGIPFEELTNIVLPEAKDILFNSGNF